MNQATNTERLFDALDKGALIIQEELDVTYLDALTEMGEFIFQGEVGKKLSEVNQLAIKKELDKLPSFNTINKEESRRAMQLAVLKGMKEATQPHHAMTPDAVSLFIGYLVNKVLGYDKKEQPPVILDPAVGSGNLLTAVMNQINGNVHGIGGEADETLLRLAYVNANLQEHSVDLFHQDSIATPFVKNVDVILSDLPVGYYPKDDIAKQYHLQVKHGHSFVHHLLIEQSLNHVKPGGFLFFLVPNFIFETEEAKELHNYLKSESYIYSLMQLPNSMFKKDQWGKSIIVLRKKDEGIKEPRQALLVELPSFSKQNALNDMIQRISTWFDDHK